MNASIGCQFYTEGAYQTDSCRSLDQAVSTDDSLTYPKASLVIRLRSRQPQANRSTLSDLRTKREQCPAERVLIRYSPIIKPKSSKVHSRRCSSGVRTSGAHFDFPTTLETQRKPSGHIHRFPTMLMLKLMERKLKVKETKVTSSPSLKYVNLQCPAAFAEKPKRPPHVRRRSKANNPKIRVPAYTGEIPELFSIRQLTAQPIEERLRPYSPLIERTDATEGDSVQLRRKVVFTRRENVTEVSSASDPYYDLSVGSYYV